MVLKYIKKEIPGISIITIASYFAVFFYYYGHSNFYGYPKEFINIDFTSVLNTGFWLFFISLITILNIRYFMEIKKINFLTCFVVFFLISIGSYVTYLIRGSAYNALYNEKMIYLGVYAIFIIPFFIYVGLKRFIKNRKNYRFLLFFFMLGASFIPYSVGWGPDTDNILKSDKGFLLARYGDYFVLGKCRKEESSFQLVKMDSNIEFKQVKKDQKIQIIICFNNSSAIH